MTKQNSSLIVAPDEKEDYFNYLDGKDFWEINKAAYHATVTAHSKKLPCLTIEVGELDAYHFGQLFYFFQFACYLSCKIMGVNALTSRVLRHTRNGCLKLLENKKAQTFA